MPSMIAPSHPRRAHAPKNETLKTGAPKNESLKNGAPMRLVLTGCSGAGKSTLLAELARRGWRTAPEAGRIVVEAALESGAPVLPWDNPAGFVERAAAIAAGQHAAARRGVTVFDRGLVDVVSYLAYRGLETPPALARLAAARRYHRTVLVLPPWRALYRDDGARGKDFAEARREYAALTRAWRRLGYRLAVLPFGSVAARADRAERFIAGEWS